MIAEAKTGKRLTLINGEGGEGGERERGGIGRMIEEWKFNNKKEERERRRGQIGNCREWRRTWWEERERKREMEGEGGREVAKKGDGGESGTQT